MESACVDALVACGDAVYANPRLVVRGPTGLFVRRTLLISTTDRRSRFLAQVFVVAPRDAATASEWAPAAVLVSPVDAFRAMRECMSTYKAQK